MRPEFEPVPRTSLSSRAPVLRLRFGLLFWHATLVAFAIREYRVWRYVTRFVPESMPAKRFLGFLYHSPKSFYVALLIGAGVAVVADLLCRFVARPFAHRWYRPRPADPMAADPLPFVLAPGETPLATIPARRLDGRDRQPGTFVLSDRSLRFLPLAWDAEGWSLPLDKLRSVRREPTVRRVLGYLDGYPDHLVFEDADGGRFALIAADPEAVLGLFDAPASTPLSEPRA